MKHIFFDTISGNFLSGMIIKLGIVEKKILKKKDIKKRSEFYNDILELEKDLELRIEEIKKKYEQ